MTEPLLMGAIVLYFFTRAIFERPPEKSPEQKLESTLTQYLGTGVKIRIETNE